MRILYVYPSDWPRNAPRAHKQTLALAGAGHEVLMLAQNAGGEPRRTSEAWMRVERLPQLGSRSINRYLGFPVFANPFWAGWIASTARRFRPDALIVSDLPLAPAGLAVGRTRGISVHYDMADVYPVAMRSNLMDHPGVLARFTRNATIADRVDRFVVRHAATVFVVSEESRQRCLAFGAQPASVVIVGNTPLEVVAPDYHPPAPADIADWVGRPLALFLGNLLADRGLADAIDAIDRVRHEMPDAGLVIVGDGREKARLMALVEQRDLGNHVRFTGWKAPADHAAYYRQAFVGLLPFRSTEHINITLANKLFDYMGAGLPIIGTDGPPMRRVLAETGAGVVVPSENPEALAAAIVALMRDPARRRTLGERGRAAVTRGAYAWERDRARFLAAIERFGRR